MNRYAGKTEYFPVKKDQVERNTVQETLVIPLYVHMLCTKAYPNEQAAELIASLNVDFKELENKSKGLMYRFGVLETAMRQIDLAWEVWDYLKTYTESTVVNHGCGLDLTRLEMLWVHIF